MATQRTRLRGRKHLFFAGFGLATLFVFYLYEAPHLDPHSAAWLHVAKVKWWLLPHATAGTVAFMLAPLPSAIPIAFAQALPSVVMAAVVQSSAWVLNGVLAVYCLRRYPPPAGGPSHWRPWRCGRRARLRDDVGFTFAVAAPPRVERDGRAEDVLSPNAPAKFPRTKDRDGGRPRPGA